MLKWKNPSQKKYVALADQRKSIQFGNCLPKKLIHERLSSKKLSDRRSITQSNEQNVHPPNIDGHFSKPTSGMYAKKSIIIKRSESNYRFLGGKKIDRFAKEQHKYPYIHNDVNLLDPHNRHTIITGFEWQSKVLNQAATVGVEKCDKKWKKSCQMANQTEKRLKQNFNHINSRRESEGNQHVPKYFKKKCETDGNDSESIIPKNQRELFKDEENQKSVGKTVEKKQKMGEMVKKFFPKKLKKEEEKMVCEQKQEKINENMLQTIDKIGAGTFGQVFTVRNKVSGKQYAVKKIYNDKTHKNRQIEIMNMIKSNFVIKKLHNYSTFLENDENKEYIHIVMPQYEANLFEFFKKTSFNAHQDLFKILMYQMFRGILYLHSRGICHRDLKPQNILIKGSKIVICDLGSAKILKPDEENIAYICSRCYRAPQLIFGYTQYSVNIDIWSAGCIILEFLNKNPLFIGKDSLHHLVEVIKVLGTPTKTDILNMNPNYDCNSFNMPQIKARRWSNLFPNLDSNLEDLLKKIMVYDPFKRISAGEVLCHPYFSQIREQNFLRSMQKKYNICISEFFHFDEQQMKIVKRPQKLIPYWYQS